MLQCQAYWRRKPDDSTSFSSVNGLKEIAEVVVLIDISAAFLSCVLCVHIATGLAKKATPNTQLCQLTGLFSKLFQCRLLHEICNKVIVNFSHISQLTSIMSLHKITCKCNKYPQTFHLVNAVGITINIGLSSALKTSTIHHHWQHRSFKDNRVSPGA